jgi:hypothetical protein
MLLAQPPAEPVRHIAVYVTIGRTDLAGRVVHDIDFSQAAELPNAREAVRRAKGRIGLQVIAGQVRFRNVRLWDVESK